MKRGSRGAVVVKLLRSTRLWIGAAIVSLSLLGGGAIVPSGLNAAPLRIHAPEGSAHGFLVLRDAKAELLADGDWWQVPNGDRLDVHLRFRFTDGSFSEEMFGLRQQRVWRLLTYRSIQRGPSFPRDIDAQLDCESGRYRTETKER